MQGNYRAGIPAAHAPAAAIIADDAHTKRAAMNNGVVIV